MLLFGLIIFLTGAIGTIVTLRFFIPALFSRKANRWKRTGISFTTTAILTIFLILVQVTIVFPPNPRTNELVLSAYREASIGGVWLGLYPDSTWELGNSSREIKLMGTYSIVEDTLNLKVANGETFNNGEQINSFIIRQTALIEVENSGISYLEIGFNKLNQAPNN